MSGQFQCIINTEKNSSISFISSAFGRSVLHFIFLSTLDRKRTFSWSQLNIWDFLNNNRQTLGGKKLRSQRSISRAELRHPCLVVSVTRVVTLLSP